MHLAQTFSLPRCNAYRPDFSLADCTIVLLKFSVQKSFLTGFFISISVTSSDCDLSSAFIGFPDSML